MRLWAIIALLAVTWAGSASAQVPTLGRLPNFDAATAFANNISVQHNPSIEQRDEAAMQVLVHCVVLKQPSDVAVALGLKVDSAAYLKSLVSLASAKCAPAGRYSFNPATFRSALFRELYKTQFKHGERSAPENLINYDDDVDNPTSDFGKSYLASRKLADCVVMADPENSRKLVMLDAGDRREEKAFDNIMKPLQNCLPLGQDVSLKKHQVTGWIAEALYRETQAASRAKISDGNR